MWYLNVLFLLIPGVFSSTSTKSITVRHEADKQFAFEVKYSNMGKNYTEFSGNFSTDEERTINIPQEATNVQLYACFNEPRPCVRDISRYLSDTNSLKSRITISGYSPWTYDIRPKPRPAEGYSITVYQVGDFRSLLKVFYKNPNNLYEFHSSGEISNGESKTIRIPDLATHISFTVYAYSHEFNMSTYEYNMSTSDMEMIFTKSFEEPVKTCYESRDNQYIDHEWGCYQKACPGFLADGNNRISVRQTSSSKIQLIVDHQNIYEPPYMQEFSDEFSKGENRSIQIPNESRNIWVFLKWRDLYGETKFKRIATYDSPGKRCFKANISSISYNWSEESC